MDTEKEINSLKDELDRLTKALSEARKQGKDTKMAELIIMTAPSKIQYAEISGDSKDIGKARVILSRVKQEVENALER